MALRSPLRRVGLFLLTPFLLFGLVDLGRTLAARTPTLVPADAYEAGFSREHITAHGLAHLEAGIAYNISTYSQHQVFGKPIKVEPFALLPLNVPERSEGRVLLAEVPLDSEGQLPDDLLDRDRFEFTGLAGLLPGDLHRIVAKDFAPGTRFSRVQVRIGPPRIAKAGMSQSACQA